MQKQELNMNECEWNALNCENKDINPFFHNVQKWSKIL